LEVICAEDGVTMISLDFISTRFGISVTF
jgi:hypothetical protein